MWRDCSTRKDVSARAIREEGRRDIPSRYSVTPAKRQLGIVLFRGDAALARSGGAAEPLHGSAAWIRIAQCLDKRFRHPGNPGALRVRVGSTAALTATDGGV